MEPYEPRTIFHAGSPDWETIRGKGSKLNVSLEVLRGKDGPSGCLR
jgi:hypothetical protein